MQVRDYHASLRLDMIINMKKIIKRMIIKQV